jgi:hypothetical protein
MFIEVMFLITVCLLICLTFFYFIRPVKYVNKYSDLLSFFVILIILHLVFLVIFYENLKKQVAILVLFVVSSFYIDFYYLVHLKKIFLESFFSSLLYANYYKMTATKMFGCRNPPYICRTFFYSDFWYIKYKKKLLLLSDSLNKGPEKFFNEYTSLIFSWIKAEEIFNKNILKLFLKNSLLFLVIFSSVCSILEINRGFFLIFLALNLAFKWLKLVKIRV